MIRRWLTVGAILSVSTLAACTRYYQVADPSTGRTYFTTQYDQDRAGAVVFKDTVTGSRVTIQNSEIREISSDQYEAGKMQSAAKATTQPK